MMAATPWERAFEEIKSRVTIVPAEPGPDTCPICQGAQYVSNGVTDVYDPHYGGIVPCDCYAPVLAQRRMERLVGDSGLEGCAGINFGTKAPFWYHQDAWDAAVEWNARREGFLWLYGPSGEAKSTLAMCLGNEALREGVAVLCREVTQVMNKIYAAMGRQDGPSVDDIIEALCGPQLVILDELGKEPPTPFCESQVYTILNRRWSKRYPTVVTTNMPDLSGLSSALRSRIEDSTVVTRVYLQPEPRPGARP